VIHRHAIVTIVFTVFDYVGAITLGTAMNFALMEEVERAACSFLAS